MRRYLTTVLAVLSLVGLAFVPSVLADEPSDSPGVESGNPPSPGGPGVAWPNVRVDVADYMQSEWNDEVEGLMNEFEDLVQATRPNTNFVYHNMPQHNCDWVRRNHNYNNKPLAICYNQGIDAAGHTIVGDKHHHQFIRVKIAIDVNQSDHEVRQTLCHEFGHAITWMNDNEEYPFQTTSCTQGDELEHPGSFDAAFIEEVYSRWGGACVHDQGPCR